MFLANNKWPHHTCCHVSSQISIKFRFYKGQNNERLKWKLNSWCVLYVWCLMAVFWWFSVCVQFNYLTLVISVAWSLPEMRDSRLQINASLLYKPNKKLREAKYLCQSRFTMQCYDSSARGEHVENLLVQLWYTNTFKLIWHQETCVQDANHTQIFRSVMLILTLLTLFRASYTTHGF